VPSSSPTSWPPGGRADRRGVGGTSVNTRLANDGNHTIATLQIDRNTPAAVDTKAI